MAHNSGDELKKRARLAKQRLKMGYWQSVCRENDDTPIDGINAPVYGQRISIGAYDAQDERLYKKVCDILDKDETTINPIGQLIDSDLYERLDSQAKQRYVLELSNKFRELKERYYREKTGA